MGLIGCVFNIMTFYDSLEKINVDTEAECFDRVLIDQFIINNLLQTKLSAHE